MSTARDSDSRMASGSAAGSHGRAGSLEGAPRLRRAERGVGSAVPGCTDPGSAVPVCTGAADGSAATDRSEAPLTVAVTVGAGGAAEAEYPPAPARRRSGDLAKLLGSSATRCATGVDQLRVQRLPQRLAQRLGRSRGAREALGEARVQRSRRSRTLDISNRGHEPFDCRIHRRILAPIPANTAGSSAEIACKR